MLPTTEPPTGQIAFVVGDVISGVESWTTLGVGPWNVWTFDERMLRRSSYRGQSGTFAARVALCSIGPLTYELIEPLRGPSIWEEFIDRGSARPHHLGYYVDDIDTEIARMAALGYPLLQSGRGFGVDGDGAYAYFDSEAGLGCIVEAIMRPRQMPEPEYRFPSAP